MEGTEGCPPVTVEGDWTPSQTKTAKNKLQLYFNSKKKSSGGDCRVEVEDEAPRAAVYFRSEEVRERVLARQDHEILLDQKTVKLRLSSAACPTDSAHASADSETPQSDLKPEDGASAEETDEPVQSLSVVLDYVNTMSRDLLLMLVENVTGLDESHYSLEIIVESDRAVVTFKSPEGVEKFLTLSRSSPKLQKYKVTVRQLEATKSVRVERLPFSKMIKDMLAMYFEKNWMEPESVTMIPEEEAAIVTFSDPKVVERICIKRDYMICSTPVKVYPYYQSLSTALYGKERPTWKTPEPITEVVLHVIWEFLKKKKLFDSINDQMRPFHCSVNMEKPEVKLSPVPNYVMQKGLTAQEVETWSSTALDAFRRLMSQYTAFECPANKTVWTTAEKEVRSVVKEDAVLVLDASKGVLTVAGQADKIKKIRAPVENIVLEAKRRNERQMNGVSEQMDLSPAMHYILHQEGLKKAAQDISTDMDVSYDTNTKRLTISGLKEEVFQMKARILEMNLKMSKKQMDLHPFLLEFLKTVDLVLMSQHLFISHGICAILSVDFQGVWLLGSSEMALTAAENKMNENLMVQTLDVEDQQVLKHPKWADLNQKLLNSYNSSKGTAVSIQIHQSARDKVAVAGFKTPVREICRTLGEYISNYSHIQDSLPVKSCAVLQFIEKKKSKECSNIEKNNSVDVSFNLPRRRIIIAGARLHVQNARACFRELTDSLFSDNFSVNKPGVKKYVQLQGSLFLSNIMSELNCVVMLRHENEDQEEEKDDGVEEEDGVCYCKVKTAGGVRVSVRKANICSFGVDGVVNAANEDLRHIGGLALALLKAAGPELQKVSDDYITNNGKLSPGDAIVTGAYNLPCKYVVHTVGPRFSDSDKKTAVQLLKRAVTESLKEAERVKCSSLALPAISSGMFGFPVPLCAETIAQAVREYCDNPRRSGSLTEIHLVDNNDNTVKVMASAVNREFNDLEPTMMTAPQAGGQRAQAAGGHERGRGRGSPPRLPREQQFSEREGGGHGGAAEAGAGIQGGHHGNRGVQSPKGNTSHGGQRGPVRMEQITAEGLKIVLWKGNIQDQTTDVIVNTIAENMNLKQGAVSNAILQAAGPRLQLAVRAEAGVFTLQYGDVVITDSFSLMCQKVFHVVCPAWDNGGGLAEEVLITIVRKCLVEAEKLKMASLSFPAIGTGNLGFPRDVVSRVLLREIHAFSSQRTQHLREVTIVVHPSDSPTVDRFSRDFKGHTDQRNVPQESWEFLESPPGQPPNQPQRASSTKASFSQVSSPSLGVYQMQMGPLSFEVSSGDITKETCDVIINSSNQTFDLQTGVSKAILDGAGMKVQLECSQIVSAPGFQPRPWIITSGGQLPSRHIIHVTGQNGPVMIKETVYSVLKVCEEKKFKSVAFPALGTGMGGADPALVADAMVGAIVDFLRKKHPKSVHSVKILIFQRNMVTAFHKSMKRREGEAVEEKNIFTKIKDAFSGSIQSLLGGFSDALSRREDLVLETEEFEQAKFQLCADNETALSQAKKRIEEFISAGQMKKTIADSYINQLSQENMDKMKELQKSLTVSIRLEKGQEDKEPQIHLEGLTGDVFNAESTIRDIIRNVERNEALKTKALLVSSHVEWQFQHTDGSMVPFDIFTNLKLEEALGKKENVKIKINNQKYDADLELNRAVPSTGGKMLELFRKDLRDAALPSLWGDMKGDLLKLFPLKAGSSEYNDVEKELTQTGLTPNIISIERVQNPTMWQSYQIKKKQLEKKNSHKNNERRLFHGTGADSIDLINEHGFNRSYAGKHAAVYGNGSYFAVDPLYSAQGYATPDANGHKRMYLARVLVGDFTPGTRGLITPPVKRSGNTSDLYDSVTDNKNPPTMFIVFHDMQAYPEYLITFT